MRLGKHISIVLLFLLLISCKKHEDETSQVNIKIENPISKTGYPGVKYEIVEYTIESEGIMNNSEVITEDSPIATGETDENGLATIEFNKKNDLDIKYKLLLNYSEMDVPGGEYEIVTGSDFVHLYHGDYTHNVNFEILPYVDYVTKIKNFNCQGPGDEMIWRLKSLYSGTGNWSVWTPEHAVFEGCIDDVYLDNHPMEVFVTEVQVTRQDGTVENFMDTSTIGTNSVDTLKVYY